MYSLKESNIGEYKTIQLVNENSGEFIEILSDFGAGINDFRITMNNSLIPVIDGYRSQQEIRDSHLTTFKSSKLSPYSNRIKNGQYTFNNIFYQMDINFPSENHSIHGLLHNRSFEIVDTKTTEHEAIIELSNKYCGDQSGYPFNYAITVRYLFRELTVSCESIIQNLSDTAIPIGDGWHPYFTTGSNIDSLYLRMPSKQVVDIDKNNMIPNGEFLPYGEFIKMNKISDRFLDNCFSVKSANVLFRTSLFDPAKNLMIKVWNETGYRKYNYIHLYTPPHRKSIAIEPTSSPPNSFNSETDLIVLRPKEKVSLSWGIEVEKDKYIMGIN